MSILFNGTNERVDYGSAGQLDSIWVGGGSIVVEVQFSDYGESGFGRILDKSTSTGSDGGWAIFLEAAGLNRFAFAHGFSGANGQWRTPNGSALTNTNYILGITYNSGSAANVPAFTINGVAQSLTTVATPTGSADSDTAQDLAMGNRTGATDRTFDGTVGQVLYYGALWAPDRMKSIAQCRGRAKIRRSLRANWWMREGAPGEAASGSGIIKDTVGVSDLHDGTPVNAPTWGETSIANRRRYTG